MSTTGQRSGARMGSDAALAPLPRGRHRLTRAEVEANQRLRLAVGMAEAMAVDGYVGTPVAAILERSGISRETFYRLHGDKLACFLEALDLVGEVLIQDLQAAVTAEGAPLELAERALGRYLESMLEQPAFARLYLVEVHAAGPAALRRRALLQERIADGLYQLFGHRSDAAHFACRAFVAAVSALVTEPLVTGDHDAVRALRRPLVAHLRMLATDGPLRPARP